MENTVSWTVKNMVAMLYFDGPYICTCSETFPISGQSVAFPARVSRVAPKTVKRPIVLSAA